MYVFFTFNLKIHHFKANQSQFQFGVIFIIVDNIVWNNFTKDMTPKDFMNQTTLKGNFFKILSQHLK